MRAEFSPRRGRIGIEILIVERQLPDLDDLELQRRRRKLAQRVGHFAIEGFLAQAADDDNDILSHALSSG